MSACKARLACACSIRGVTLRGLTAPTRIGRNKGSLGDLERTQSVLSDGTIDVEDKLEGHKEGRDPFSLVDWDSKGGDVIDVFD